MLERIGRKRVAMISGWAVDPNAIYRYQVDAAFALPITLTTTIWFAMSNS